MNIEISKRSVVSSEQRAQVTRYVTLVSVVINIVLTVLKIVIGIVEHSQSVLADGIHSLSDLLSDGVVLYASHHARQDADLQHPYGHGRFETVATLGLALLLILVAIGLAWDATWRLFDPVTLLHPGIIALVATVISIVVKEWLYHYTRIAARRIRSDMMLANAWHHRSDAISSIVVLIGLAGTIAGLPYLDAIAAIIVAVMIAQIGWELARPALQELVDTGLDTQRIQAIQDTILGVGGVKDIHMLRTRRIGGVAIADVHVLVESYLSVSEGHMISAVVEQRLKQVIDEIADVTVHIDPEDDEQKVSNLDLPMRVEAIQRIESAWQHIPEFQHHLRIMLHYLAGRINIEVYLPLRLIQDRDITQPEILTPTFQQALLPYPEFNTVTVYFG